MRGTDLLQVRPHNAATVREHFFEPILQRGERRGKFSRTKLVD